VKQLKVINQVSVAILHEARQAGDPGTALKAVDRLLRQIELQAKLLGELDERPTVNILVSGEWVSIRTALLAALESLSKPWHRPCSLTTSYEQAISQ
jgi:hypothetical protein